MARYADNGKDRVHQRSRRPDSRGSPRRRGGYETRGRASHDSDRGRRGQISGRSTRDEHCGRDRDRDRRDDSGRGQKRGGGSRRGRGGGSRRGHGSRSSHNRRRDSRGHPGAGNRMHGRGRSHSSRDRRRGKGAGGRSRSRSSDGRAKPAKGAGGRSRSHSIADRGKAGAGRKGGGGRPSSSSSPQKKKKPKENEYSDSGTDDDEIIHFDWKENMVLNSRYKLLSLLGDGTFGRVVLAQDQQNSNREVAIKIIRDVKRYMENAQIEANILKDIRKADSEGKSVCSIMYDTFTYDTKFFCLVLEPLGTSLYDFLKENEYRGYWMQDIRDYARQSMQALAFLHDKMRMTHTDLKPENVLLYSTQPARPSRFPREAEWNRQHERESQQGLKPYLRPVSSAIKIIDFGNATYEEEQHTSIINTRQYRSPEVLLSCGWNQLSDQWSIGCILMELYSGNQLFETHEEMEHLALFEKIIGRFPTALLDSASRSAKEKWFTQHSDPQAGRLRLCWPERSSSASSVKLVSSQRPLHQQVPPEHSGLTDFVAELLVLEPSKRNSAASMLRHPFLTKMQFED